jgi:hypothetical protein
VDLLGLLHLSCPCQLDPASQLDLLHLLHQSDLLRQLDLLHLLRQSDLLHLQGQLHLADLRSYRR